MSKQTRITSSGLVNLSQTTDVFDLLLVFLKPESLVTLADVSKDLNDAMKKDETWWKYIRVFRPSLVSVLETANINAREYFLQHLRRSASVEDHLIVPTLLLETQLGVIKIDTFNETIIPEKYHGTIFDWIHLHVVLEVCPRPIWLREKKKSIIHTFMNGFVENEFDEDQGYQFDEAQTISFYGNGHWIELDVKKQVVAVIKGKNYDPWIILPSLENRIDGELVRTNCRSVKRLVAMIGIKMPKSNSAF